MACAGDEGWRDPDGTSVRVLSSSRQAVTIEAVSSGEPSVGGRWASLHVHADNGWGSANISNLVVHASIGEDLDL